MTERLLEGQAYMCAHAEFSGSKLRFARDSEFERALRDGFFFVDAPPGLDCSPGDLFAENFYKDPQDGPNAAYRGFRRWTSEELGAHEGYFCRDADQVEQFFLERRMWEKIYPPALIRQAQAMQAFGLEILRAVLEKIAIPKELWDEASGYCLSGKGTYH